MASIDFNEVMFLARRMSADKIYRPELSKDLPMFKALAQIINEPESITGGSGGGGTIAVGTTTVYAFDITITGNQSSSWATLFTAAGDNTAAQVYEVTMYTENTGLGVVNGTLQSYIRWSWNDNTDSKAQTTSINQSIDGTAGQLWSSKGQEIVAIDVGTTMEWYYDVTSWTSGSTGARIAFAVRRII